MALIAWAILAATGTWGVAQLRSRTLRRRNRELAARVDERTRQLEAAQVAAEYANRGLARANARLESLSYLDGLTGRSESPSVHGHWLLVRLARTFPGAPFAPKARDAVARSLTPEHIAGEVRYLQGRGPRELRAALRSRLAAPARHRTPRMERPQAASWAATLRPLDDAAVARFKEWLPKLSKPIRIGEHDQTAFSFGLILDWARSTGDRATADMLTARVRDFYLKDRGCPMSWEPSGQDFLSPCLAEADLMRRVLPPAEFAAWLTAFLPGIPSNGSAAWLAPAVVTDPADPKLAHLDGLNLSRAWMLEGIASGLPAGDRG